MIICYITLSESISHLEIDLVQILEKQEQNPHNAEEHLVEPKQISREETVQGEVGTSEMAPPPYHHATAEVQQLQLTKETKELP